MQRFWRVFVCNKWDPFYLPCKILRTPHKTVRIFKPKCLVLTRRRCLSGNKIVVGFQCSNWMDFFKYVMTWKVIYPTMRMKTLFLYNPSVLAYDFSFTFTFYDFLKIFSCNKTPNHLFSNSRKTHFRHFPFLKTFCLSFK